MANQPSKLTELLAEFDPNRSDASSWAKLPAVAA